MKQRKKLLIIGMCIIILFITSHLTPFLAIRTHLFVTLHPSYAVSGRIVLDKTLYESNKNYFDKRKSRCYGITNMPVITSNGLYTKMKSRQINNYVYSMEVRKIWFLYFSNFIGEA